MTLPVPYQAQPPTPREEAEIEATVKNAGTSFYWGMRMLPADRRNGMFAIYAFARAVDDIADEGGALEEKRAGLDEWRREIDRVYNGEPTTVIGRALALTVERFKPRKEHFLGLIDGMQMDAEEEIQAPDMAKLDLYCYRVACTVGHLSVRVFGAPAGKGEPVAESLGRALQLTNILRDVAEDAARNRLYLPLELLEKHGVKARTPNGVMLDPKVADVCAELAETAEQHFHAASLAMDDCPKNSMRPARIMGAVYHETLKALVNRGWDNLEQHVSVPKPIKLWFAFRYGML